MDEETLRREVEHYRSLKSNWIEFLKATNIVRIIFWISAITFLLLMSFVHVGYCLISLACFFALNHCESKRRAAKSKLFTYNMIIQNLENTLTLVKELSFENSDYTKEFILFQIDLNQDNLKRFKEFL